MRLLLKDAIRDKILRVNVGLGCQQCIELGAGVSPWQFWSRGSRRYDVVVIVRSGLAACRCYQYRWHVCVAVFLYGSSHLCSGLGCRHCGHLGASVAGGPL